MTNQGREVIEDTHALGKGHWGQVLHRASGYTVKEMILELLRLL